MTQGKCCNHLVYGETHVYLQHTASLKHDKLSHENEEGQQMFPVTVMDSENEPANPEKYGVHIKKVFGKQDLDSDVQARLKSGFIFSV